MASEYVMEAQWFSIVGSSRFPSTNWNRGKFHRCKDLPELVLRDAAHNSLVGDLTINRIVTVWPGEDVQNREVRRAKSAE